MKNSEIYNINTFNKIVCSWDHQSDFGYCESRGGYQKTFTFPNNYAVSVVAHDSSYGLELALIHPDGKIKAHRDIPQTKDQDGIVGYTNVDQCNDILHRVGLIRKYTRKIQVA